MSLLDIFFLNRGERCMNSVFCRWLSGIKPRSPSCSWLPSNISAAQASKEDGKKNNFQVEQTGAKNPLSIQK